MSSDLLQHNSKLGDNKGPSVKLMDNNPSILEEDASTFCVEVDAEGEKQVDSCERGVMLQNKKKWKKLARGISSDAIQPIVHLPGCKGPKRAGIPKEREADSKNLRVANSVVEAEVVFTAVVAGNPAEHNELFMLECTGAWDPSLLFISETKVFSAQFRNWTSQIHFDGYFPVDCSRRSGGLVLFWREPFKVSIQSFSDGHIDSVVNYGDLRWRFTGFYGNPVVSLRVLSWQLLNHLGNIHELRHLPWLVGGDFNEVLFESEKRGVLLNL